MKNKVFLQVLLAIVLAVFAGLAAGPEAQIFGVKYIQAFGLAGQLFLNALMLVVIPLVSASIVIGTAKMSSEKTFGALGLRTFGFFILTTFLAILSGALFSVLLEPGNLSNPGQILSSIQDPSKMADLKALSQAGIFAKIEQILLKLVPGNIFAAASQGQMLSLIGFCLVFGYFIPKADPAHGSIILGFWQGIFQIMMSITRLVMKALPFGVFGLVAKAVAATGMDSLMQTAWFCICVLLGLAFFTFILMPLLLKFYARVSPLAHFKAVAPALFTAFSTSSSAATLPVSFDCIEKRAGVSNRIASLTLPLGITLNLSGSAMHVCVSVLFIAQVYGLPLSSSLLGTTIIMTLIASMGMAGIPSASLITTIIVLNVVGLPADAIGLIMAVERILDMCRTAVNVYSNTCCAVLVAKSEGETSVLVQPEPSRAS